MTKTEDKGVSSEMYIHTRSIGKIKKFIQTSLINTTVEASNAIKTKQLILLNDFVL